MIHKRYIDVCMGICFSLYLALIVRNHAHMLLIVELGDMAINHIKNWVRQVVRGSDRTGQNLCFGDKNGWKKSVNKIQNVVINRDFQSIWMISYLK